MNKFVLFFISVILAVSPVSAGSVRGVSREDSVGNRDLQSFDSLNRWMATCDSQLLKYCTGQFFVRCTQCVFAQSLLDSAASGLENCAEFFCNDCKEEVMNFFECGTSTSPPPPAVSTPAEPTPPTVVTPSEDPPPLVIIPTVPTPPIVSAPPTEPTNSTPVVPIGNTTSLGCPFIVPENGASCAGLIPSPFLYQTCYYREHICDCRADAPQYLCAERVFTEKPTQAPTLPPTPIPTAPPTPVVVATCSDEIDIVSGTPCATIGLSCCVNENNQCTCGSDNFFVCQPNGCGVEEIPPVTLPDIDSTPVEEELVIEEAPDEDDSPSVAKPEDIPLFDTSFFSF